MEPSFESRKSPPGARSALGGRWFVRSLGSTLGPFTIDEIRSGLEKGELEASDKVCAGGESQWTLLSEHPSFQGWIRGQSMHAFASIPSPHVLRIRKPAPLPVTPPVVAVIEIPESPPLLEIPPLEAIPPSDFLGDMELQMSEAMEEAAAALEKFVDLEESFPVVESLGVETEVKPVAVPVMEAPPAPIPRRPEPVFIADPVSWTATPQEVKKEKRSGVIQIELKVPERPWRILILLGMVIAIGYVLGTWSTNKTRDLKDSRLSDPSSPTTAPSEAGDPIPPLKAPTRPQRE